MKGFYQPAGKLTACSLGNDGAFLANYVWCLFTYPVMVLLPFLLTMTINAQLDQALNERKSELYAAAKQD
ncbi:hypothetical protein [Lactobacillus delbrueckii]|uniref:hypothetical protein n=1 Tax=Lactobacillus delbrueckii TaxID=1584 RepID=UPI001E4E991F|nr:hypothetical protein [Lactobacillus delbrueckii]MCD5533713.1 hypothetical protein [Lactobacillus delbrueckii subsp. lactis]